MEQLYSDEMPGPCSACPLELLNRYLASSEGQTLAAVVDLDFAVQYGFHVGLDQVSYLEFCLMRMLAEERQRYDAEQLKKD